MDEPLVRNQKKPTTPGREHNRSVAIIGYLPDLQPLYRRGQSESFNSTSSSKHQVPGSAVDNESSRLLWSPSTPFLSAFRAADPRKALSSWFREGSVRGSVFNLCSATLGAGKFASPLSILQPTMQLTIQLTNQFFFNSYYFFPIGNNNHKHK
jgi:hypothetical protein